MKHMRRRKKYVFDIYLVYLYIRTLPAGQVVHAADITSDDIEPGGQASQRMPVSSLAIVPAGQHTSAYVSIRQHTSAYVSIRQHMSAYTFVVAEADELAGGG
jgi:hypothetical protein